MLPPYQTISERSSAGSGGVEKPLSEEVPLGSSLHLAFEELQSRHSTPGLLKALHASLGKPVAYLKDTVRMVYLISLALYGTACSLSAIDFSMYLLIQRVVA
jgi:hypothetical protein